MSLLIEKTKWVLFLSSSKEPEHRHIFDLAFGLGCLESKKISPDDISIYIDGSSRDEISNLISQATTNKYEIKYTIDFFSDQKNNTHENLVMFITGHGSIDGIDANPPVNPHTLIQCLKKSPNLKKTIVYLGQCHAGVFNYINASGKRNNDGKIIEPDVVLIGATNLHESVSSSTNEMFINGEIPWIANLFLLHVFKWFSNPLDIDGDSKPTIMDSFKYAGAMSNIANKQIKVTTFYKSVELQKQIDNAITQYRLTPTSHTDLICKSLITQYETLLNVRYTHQECWILNSIPAQHISL